MKFKDFKYERPNYEKVKELFNSHIARLRGSSSAEQQYDCIKNINELRNHIQTMSTLTNIRHTIDTQDKYYDDEQNYWDEYSPLYEELNSVFYKEIVNSKFRHSLEEKLGKQFFTLAEFSLKGFSPEVIEDLQLENKLASEYTKLLASAKIQFKGEEKNLSGLVPFIQSKDREVRKEASQAKYDYFVQHEADIDRIYDDLVKVRTKIARKLGFKNFVELGYVRMMRSDYNPQMVSNFRKQVQDYIVPAASKLYERQTNRLGLDKLSYYDEKFEFLSGNAIPKGDPEWIVANGVRMYSELSSETKEFFDFMVDGELLDLVTKKGKAGGGYCTYIPEYKSPFIFSNFNGTSGDVDVLTHEAGHAFQVYSSRWIEIPECNFPTYESCEIHSMSMEFFTWPWMNLFFEEDADKYKFIHLGSAIKFIPYGVTVDEFQHYVYENPDVAPAERKMAWREIEKKYLPHKNYEGCDFLERGGWWFQQSHIFTSPFYYIDYTLAQICALQFWKRANENREDAWKDYVELCRVGGTKSFLELVSYANLKSPFEDGCVSSIITSIEQWLDSVDDKKL
ncbi:M3 family oligoendopeptidase [Clostridium folliculivorans]|uniref:Oligoendopeptidase F n=1 Tax=Clostridium folliculivorans TaxID=2886038 RepID=A0A9W6DBT2_9CLOT|nr:M3 family oligoendopeptidase [Clostridium folliculivorans]GKU26252.1 oligoendopeptidase F [Clostridium folliculivorans]GKU31924.1 oligoendopeptidase F [Clostridium folliculivorans]